MERIGVHKIPFGKLVDDEIFGNWYVVDLTKFELVK